MPPARREARPGPDLEALKAMQSGQPALAKAPAGDPVRDVVQPPTATSVTAVPPVPPVPQVPAVRSVPARGSDRTNTERVAAGQGGDRGRSDGKVQVKFYIDADTAQRTKAAYLGAGLRAGHRSYSEFLEAAAQKYARELEQEFNGGTPWPRPTGGLPTGRQPQF